MTIPTTEAEAREAFKDPAAYERYRKSALKIGPRVAPQPVTVAKRIEVAAEVERIRAKMFQLESDMAEAAGNVAVLASVDGFQRYYSDSREIKAALDRGDVATAKARWSWYNTQAIGLVLKAREAREKPLPRPPGSREQKEQLIAQNAQVVLNVYRRSSGDARAFEIKMLDLGLDPDIARELLAEDFASIDAARR